MQYCTCLQWHCWCVCKNKRFGEKNSVPTLYNCLSSLQQSRLLLGNQAALTTLCPCCKQPAVVHSPELCGNSPSCIHIGTAGRGTGQGSPFESNVHSAEIKMVRCTPNPLSDVGELLDGWLGHDDHASTSKHASAKRLRFRQYAHVCVYVCASCNYA